MKHPYCLGLIVDLDTIVTLPRAKAKGHANANRVRSSLHKVYSQLSLHYLSPVLNPK